MDEPLLVSAIVSLPFEENTYVVRQPGGRAAVVIDPGLEPRLILDFLDQEKLDVAAILNTHGHADHIGGNGVLKQHWPQAPLIIGAGEQRMLSDPNANLSAPFGIPITSPPADRMVREGDVLEFAGVRLEVLEVPGHSPGHVLFIVRGTPCQAFSGDVLFRGGIGRSDFPGGNGSLLLHSIRDKIFALPDDTIIYPGHGPATTVGEEKQSNPFLAEPEAS